MKQLSIILLCALCINATAQVKQVTLQASGLTCSMCSKAIYKALEKLSVADSLSSNISEATYTLTFKKDTPVDFDVIRKAVENAGFSVINMQVKANFDHVQIQNDAHIMLGGKALHFLEVKEQVLTGEQTFQIVDKKFVADKVYKKYAATTHMECVKTGLMKPCCAKGIVQGSRIYHVTV